jgi:hypothetical protein
MQQSIQVALMRQARPQAGRGLLDPAGLETLKNNVAMVSGIGCTSRMPGHLDFQHLPTAARWPSPPA